MIKNKTIKVKKEDLELLFEAFLDALKLIPSGRITEWDAIREIKIKRLFRGFYGLEIKNEKP